MSDEPKPGQKLSRQAQRRLEREQRKINSISTSPAEKTAAERYMAVIRDFVKRRGIKISTAELQLWQPHDFIPADESLPPLSEETVHAALTNTKETMSLMEGSENRLFQETVLFFESYHDDITLVLDIEQPLYARNRAAFMGVSMDIDPEDDTYNWLLDINPQYMAVSPRFYSAVSLVHERRHLEDFMKSQQGLPEHSTATERLLAHQTRIQNDRIYMIDEARGWGEQCEAVIVEYGLGFEGKLPPDLIRIASDFILMGADINSRSWREYVARNIFGLTNFRA